jgi:uncharacterized membrane protein YqaE (UPF0057 family)
MRKGFFILFAFIVTGTSFNNLSAAVIVPLSATTTEPDPARIKAAVEAFKNLSKKERKGKLKEAKKEIKEFKKAKKAGKEADTNTILLVILALILPPLAVYLHQEEANNKFWITLLLFVLGLLGVFFISGFLILVSIIYALIVILGGS